MKNKKGFTLIELLAVIVILGIVIAIAIPGINSVINNARKNTYVQTAHLAAEGVRNGISGNVFPQPASENALVVKINSIEMEKGGKKSPYGFVWDNDLTYVIAANQNGKIVYYFAGRDTAGNTVQLINLEELKSNNVLGSNFGGTVISSITPTTIGISGTISVYGG